MMKTDVVLGLQFGSEAKGQVVHILAHTEEYSYIIKSSTKQAGHTVVAPEGKFVSHWLPSVVAPPERTKLVLGPATIANLVDLVKEIESALPWLKDGQLLISRTIKLSDWVDPAIEEELVKKIGSTGSGVGASRAQLMLRKLPTLNDVLLLQPRTQSPEGFEERWGKLQQKYGLDSIPSDVLDAIEVIYELIKEGKVQVIDYYDWIMGKILDTRPCKVLVEGTQGYGLSLNGRYYPHCTSTDVNTSTLLGANFIPPQTVDEVWGIMRIHPIRVGGPSGPMKDELDWGTIAVGNPEVEPEKTTVTKRIRRVGRLDLSALVEAILINGVNNLVINFSNYLPPAEQESMLMFLKQSFRNLRVWLGTISPDTQEIKEL
jgi:adenylosuccinate synthase